MLRQKHFTLILHILPAHSVLSHSDVFFNNWCTYFRKKQNASFASDATLHDCEMEKMCRRVLHVCMSYMSYFIFPTGGCLVLRWGNLTLVAGCTAPISPTKRSVLYRPDGIEPQTVTLAGKTYVMSNVK